MKNKPGSYPDALSVFVTDRALLLTRILMDVDRTIYNRNGM